MQESMQDQPQAALDTIERDRTELACQSSRDERRVYEEAMEVIL
jgi:hypothetical protein